jgi:hypothetical protein
MFVAWGSGQLDDSGLESFLLHDSNFRHLPAIALNKPAAILQLANLGAGDETLFIHPSSNKRLVTLLEETAAEIGVPVASPAELSQQYGYMTTSRIPWLFLSWNSDAIAQDRDRLERIKPEKLQTSGQVLALALTKMVRETRY